MPNLYIITGPSGVGKSTISKKLAESSNKSALIEGDFIYAQVISSHVSAWKEENHLDVFWEVCLNSIETYLSYGYDVVFNYIVTPTIVNRIKDRFKNDKTKFIVLLSDEETLLSRDKQRPEDCQMKERCLILLNSFKSKNYNSNNILDTTNLSIEDTLNTIINDTRFIL
jgi:guanylate kinase